MDKNFLKREGEGVNFWKKNLGVEKLFLENFNETFFIENNEFHRNVYRIFNSSFHKFPPGKKQSTTFFPNKTPSTDFK